MIHRLFIRKSDRKFLNEVFGWYASRSKKDRKALALNGCGPKIAGWAVPELAFHEACDLHDLLYFMGGTKRDRWAADGAFLDLMLAQGRFTRSKRSRWARAKVWFQAHLYFWAVRALGAGSFSWGRQKTLGEMSQVLYRNRH